MEYGPALHSPSQSAKHDAGQIASLLQNISDKNSALIDLSVRQSALEDMYVELMEDTASP